MWGNIVSLCIVGIKGLHLVIFRRVGILGKLGFVMG